ncbi:hypothetical protein PUN28_003424 [Cardiocondyla obscurior]|uniref:ATP synthase F0 subunit 8 n=1 Tax=Cardiocondyla obscurior TaxID=286306 RepID=A0AAW2GMN1_9HYME
MIMTINTQEAWWIGVNIAIIVILQLLHDYKKSITTFLYSIFILRNLHFTIDCFDKSHLSTSDYSKLKKKQKNSYSCILRKLIFDFRNSLYNLHVKRFCRKYTGVLLDTRRNTERCCFRNRNTHLSYYYRKERIAETEIGYRFIISLS